MTRAANRRRAGSGPVPPRVPRRGDLGLGALVVTPEVQPSGPATNASWAWNLRRFARAMIWSLPAYAVVYGLVTLGDFAAAGQPVYLTEARPWHLLGWLAAIWLGEMALLALAALLAATRSRRAAASALLVGTAGVALTLPFAGLPGQTPVFAGDARLFVLFGASVYAAGWMLMGRALLESGVFTYGDGVLLIFAGPLLGPVGLLVQTVQTVGALLVLAASIGVVWRSGRLLPVGDRGFVAVAAARAADGPAAVDGPAAADRLAAAGRPAAAGGQPVGPGDGAAVGPVVGSVDGPAVETVLGPATGMATGIASEAAADRSRTPESATPTVAPVAGQDGVAAP